MFYAYMRALLLTTHDVEFRFEGGSWVGVMD